MMKQIFTASAVAILAASPALAVTYKAEPKPGTPGSHVQISDARGGYTSGGTYVDPHNRMSWNAPFWRVNPVTGPALLAAAPLTGGYEAYAYAPPAGDTIAASPLVIDKGKVLGADPDPAVRLQMRRGSVRFE